jgi:peptide chain release factor 2
LWQQHAEVEKLLRRKTRQEATINVHDNLQKKIAFAEELATLEPDNMELQREVYADLQKLVQEITTLSLEVMFHQPRDGNDCFLEINTGVGGTDACDFSEMLLNMYLRWSQHKGFSNEIVNLQSGDEAGITNAVVHIRGANAYGWLRYESGIHRLVRISPYNANGKRQTSFSSVNVYPVLDDTIKVELDEKHLKIDTYRSSGAGGQHVNKTDSAVRITHLPTGIVVQCQNQRSQHRNKEEALQLLKSRLYEMELEHQRREKEEYESKKTNIGLGCQIRNYVMHPYQLVKDLRSGQEINNFERMLNGDYLDDFIRSVIRVSLCPSS